VILVAVDPGKITGFFVWSEGQVLLHEQLPCHDFLDWVEEVVPMYAGFDLTMAAESFLITAQTVKKAADAHWSIGSNFVLGRLCQRHQVHLELQTPATAKSFSTDAKLRRLGWYKPTKGGHANDAARHGVVRLVELGRLSIRDLS
jgi:hypothetical protein